MVTETVVATLLVHFFGFENRDRLRVLLVQQPSQRQTGAPEPRGNLFRRMFERLGPRQRGVELVGQAAAIVLHDGERIDEVALFGAGAPEAITGGLELIERRGQALQRGFETNGRGHGFCARDFVVRRPSGLS